MIYEALHEYSDEDIMNILYSGSDDELKNISLSVGEYHKNFLFAQDVCFFLMENRNEEIRANAVLGLSYIARRFRKLDVKKMIFLLNKNKTFSDEKLKERVEIAMEDICLFTGEDISV